MERYIEQLIGDIQKATWNMRPPREIWDDADPDYDVELEDMAYVEKYIYGEKESISAITGIDLEMLPEHNKLTYDQQSILAIELEKLLENFNFYLEFPTSYPSHLRYPFIRKFWKEEHVALSFGENLIEFCNYEEAFCPFPGYCDGCKLIAEQMEFDQQMASQTPTEIIDEDDLPF